MTIKVNDIKGKFIKPALKKVNKTQSKLVFNFLLFQISIVYLYCLRICSRFAKLEKLEKPEADFRATLKSTGKDKFALEDDKKDDKVDFREQLKSAKEHQAEEE